MTAGLRPCARAIALNADRPGLEQVNEALSRTPGVREIHLVSHGEPGRFQLGSDWIDARVLKNNYLLLSGWRQLLSPDAEILIYGCRVAAQETGCRLMERLYRLTGANVAASATPTGCASKGGDWELETRLGIVRALPAFTAATQRKYPSILISTPCRLIARIE